MKAGEWIVSALVQLGAGARALRRSPGYSIAAVCLLSLAIGANTAMFSVIEGVLLRPLPYKDADRLCVLWKSVPGKGIEWDWTSAPTVKDWREQSESFEDIALVLRPEGSRVALDGADGPEKVQGAIVSGNFFDILGVPPLAGRTFSSEEARLGENVVVLGHGFWRSRFAGSPSIVGQTIRIDGRSTTVAGVMPPSFQFPNKEVRLWLLLTADPRWEKFQLPRYRLADAFFGLARLAEGRSLTQARGEMEAVAGRLARLYPATDAGLGIRVAPLSEQISGRRVRTVLWTLAGAAFLVLLIACSNLASLAAARNAARQREFAVRSALGASPSRLGRQLATESLLLSGAGGLGGIALASLGLRLILALTPAGLERAGEIALNGPALGFCFGLCAFAALASGLLPAWRSLRTGSESSSLSGGHGGPTGDAGAQRVWSALVLAQFSLAFVLSCGGGLLVRSAMVLDSVDRGFDPAHLLSVTVSLPPGKYPDGTRVRTFFDEAIPALERLPGVEGAAAGSVVSHRFQGNAPNQSIVVEGRAAEPDGSLHSRIVVSDRYFSLLGIPLEAGRLFDESERSGTTKTAVINKEMARRFWPSERATGKRFQQALPGMKGDWITVIGVAGNAIYSRDGAVVPTFYLPARQWSFTEHELVVRAWGDPRALAGAVRKALHAIDPSLPGFEAAAVDDLLAEQDRPRRFQAQLIGAFGVIAAAIAAAGLYGLMAYTVERRRREIGVRLALGATRTRVALLVLERSLGLGAVGMAAGALGALLAGDALRASIHGIAPTDPVTFLAVTALLFAVAILASAAPALRAFRVDPMAAIRR